MLLSGAKIQTAAIDADVDLPGFDLVEVRRAHSRSSPESCTAASYWPRDAEIAICPRSPTSTSMGLMPSARGHDETRSRPRSYREHQVKAELKVHEPSGGFLGRCIRARRAECRRDATRTEFFPSTSRKSEGESIPIRMLRGVLDAQLSAKGPLDAPLVTGHSRVREGRVGSHR